MTNREAMDRLSNDSLADRFCYELGKDGKFCKEYCPFEKLCRCGESGFKTWLEQEYEGEL